jgi:hypothetical protein
MLQTTINVFRRLDMLADNASDKAVERAIIASRRNRLVFAPLAVPVARQADARRAAAALSDPHSWGQYDA